MSHKNNLLLRVDELDNDLDIINNNDLDVTLKLLEEHGESAGELTPEIEREIKRKLWIIILPMVSAVNFMLFFDKNAMGYASLLGMFEDLELTQEKYNNLQTIFYAGYMLFQIPSHYIFQRIPLSWYITGSTFIWTLTTFSTLFVNDFKQLATIRFILGCFESGVTPCLEHTIAMWFTPSEQAIVNPIFWISCLSQGIPGGFLAYCVQFVSGISPWKVYWLIMGSMSATVSAAAYFFYPDNPATYTLFTVQERVFVIKRIKEVTNSSIEQKAIKKYQVVEALKDPITWLFGIFVFLNQLSNNIGFQAAIIYKSLGFSNLSSTVVSIVGAIWTVMLALIGSFCLKRSRSQTAHVATLFSSISFTGGLIAALLPFHHKKGILAGIFLTHANGVTFISAFSWCQSSAAGYSKKLVRTIVWSVFYGSVNIISPQLWRSKDQPRYHFAWGIIIIGSYFCGPIVLQTIRFILSRKNRDRLQRKTSEQMDNEIIHRNKNGVDLSMLDLTDIENHKFIYPL